MKTVLKDAQITLRMSGDLADKIRASAKELNLSMADYVVKLYQERENKSNLEARLEALERAVFHQTQAA